jgi:drug/metabolite transporter (DMT)-like permease
MKKNKIIAFVLIIIASIIWGVSFVSKEILLVDIHPGSLIAFQLLCVSVILGVYNFLIRKKFTIKRKDFISLFGTGIVGLNLYNVFCNMGIKETNSSMVSVLLALIPIACLLVDRIMYKKKFTKLKVLCILGSFIGVYMVIGSGGMSVSGSLIGYLYTIIGVLAWVVFCFISDKFYSRYDSMEILFVQSLGAFSTTFFYLIIHPIHLNTINADIFVHFFVLIILNACISFAFYIVAIRELGVTVTNVFNNIVPVVTLFVNMVFFNVEIGIISILGTAVIIVSVIVLNVFDRSCEECDMNVNVETKYVEHVN